ncbi:MAG: nucleotidyl transferase AbiEii/AbiGii toxin family protein [Candidatus Micrarchaeota archaeon]|nr:nucleotidyl transferase AbiEii/AbiGii toxin family protein [Candidatus Micrarchaeota archaeon]
MESIFERKYGLATAILADVADCIDCQLILVGGTALALFYLQHRVSVDLDFVPLSGGDVAAAKQALKGCMSKKGYTTQTARWHNQFIVQSETTSIKVEVFTPDEKVGKTEKRVYGSKELLVASLGDLLKMKTLAFSQRGKARDLFDVVAILLKTGKNLSFAEELAKKRGIPDDVADLGQMAPDEKVLAEFKKVIGK